MPIQNESDKVRAVQAEIGKALIQKDLDRAISLMTTDVTLLGSKGPAVVGHDATRRLYVDLYSKFDITVSNAECTVDLVGDAAVVVGRQTTTLVPVQGGRPITIVARVVGVYRREAGAWKLARALSVLGRAASTRGIPSYQHRSDLLRRAQAEPGRIIYPEVA